MRLGFRTTPTDLLLCMAIALAIIPLVVAGIGGPLRYLLALALVFLVPGYALAATLFPRTRELDAIRRTALSVGLSIAVIALCGLLVDLLPAGLSVPDVLGALVLLSLGTSAVAWWRRLRVPAQDRLGLSVDVTRTRWRDLTVADRLLAILVAIALVSGVTVVAVGLAHPPAPDRFTEFYLLAPDGGLVNYTLSINTTDPGVVIVGVHNLEGMPINYTIIVLLIPLTTVYNATSGHNETVEGNPTFFGSFPVNLTSGATSETPYTFPIPLAGDYLLEFRLYMGVPQGAPYRFVDLRVHVS